MPWTPSVQSYNWEGRLRPPVQATTCGAPSEGQSHQQENTKSWGSASLQLRSYAGQARRQSTGWDSPGCPGSWENHGAPDKLSTDSPGWPEILHMLRQLQSGLAPPTRSSMTEPTPIRTTKMQGGFSWKNKPGQTQHLPENCTCSPAHTHWLEINLWSVTGWMQNYEPLGWPLGNEASRTNKKTNWNRQQQPQRTVQERQPVQAYSRQVREETNRTTVITKYTRGKSQ